MKCIYLCAFLGALPPFTELPISTGMVKRREWRNEIRMHRRPDLILHHSNRVDSFTDSADIISLVLKACVRGIFCSFVDDPWLNMSRAYAVTTALTIQSIHD